MCLVLIALIVGTKINIIIIHVQGVTVQDIIKDIRIIDCCRMIFVRRVFQ
jgi:hypothetical protein